MGCAAAQAEVRVSNLFGDNMVLQRDMPAPVWGTADPGEAVTVTIGDAHATAKADGRGEWSVNLPAMKANAAPQDLVIRGRDNTLTVRNVLVGDVWLCSGQSNMEITFGYCNVTQDIAAAALPTVRCLRLAHTSRAAPSREVPGQWMTCTPSNAVDFSGVGFYFARRLHQETGLPIGLIQSAWGGTRIEAWIPPCGYEMETSLPDYREEIKRRHQAYRAEVGKSLAAVEQWVADTRVALALPVDQLPTVGNLPALPISPIVNPGLHNYSYPAALYNGMIHPLVPFAIKGILWYQGEANYGDGPEYYTKTRALVGGWRKLWNQPPSQSSGASGPPPQGSGESGGDVPFYFAQLPNFEKPNPNPAGGDGWAHLRMAQLRCMQMTNVGMAVTIDLGESNNIHPKNKRDVGERLARWALHNEYGRKDVAVSGPLYKSMTVENGKIRIRFDYVAGGLMVGKKEGAAPAVADDHGTLRQFAIAGDDGKWVWADAVIDGDAVVVSSPQVPRPAAVRYAYSWNPAGCNLYNKAGLPASPFRTDDD